MCTLLLFTVDLSPLTYIQAAASVNVGVEGLTFGWRVSLGFQFLYVFVMFIGFPLLPESPRYDNQYI